MMKWRDRREVLAISSEHTNYLVEVTNRRGDQKLKPKAISMYNKYMSGIDRQDQMLSYYPCERKTVRWYKKIGIHFFQLFLLNAYYLYVENVKKCSLYDFRLSVITALVKNQTSINVPPILPNKKKHALSYKSTKKQKKNNILKKDVRFAIQTTHGKQQYFIVAVVKVNLVFENCKCKIENCFEIYHA